MPVTYFSPFGASSIIDIAVTTTTFALPTMPAGTPAVMLVGQQSGFTAWFVTLGTAAITTSSTTGIKYFPGSPEQPLIIPISSSETHIAILCEGTPGKATMTAGALISGATTTVLADNAVTDAKLRDSGALSVIGRSANTAGDPADISATAASDQVLRESGSVLGFGTVATAGLANDAVTDAKLRNSGALSVVGRSANSSGDPADISATAASDAVLRESGSVLGFGTVATGGIANDAVTFAKIQNITTDRLLGRDTALTGDVEEISLNATLEFTGSTSIQRAALTGDVTASAGSNTTAIADNAVTNTDLRDSGALSVIGRSANTAGDPADISATAASDAVLRESGSVLGFGTVATAGLANDAVTTVKIANDAVTYAKIQNVSATDRLLGRDTAGAGDVEELTVGGGVEFTGTGIQTSAFTGDVTKTAGGTALTTVKASTTEALTGTDASKVVTPDALAALWEKGADEASGATVSFGEGGYFHITGTTTITDIDWDTATNGRRVWVVFDGALTLTHNATTLQLPSAANITTAAGDRALFVQDAADNVICLDYVKADGTAVVGGGGGFTAATQAEMEAATSITVGSTPGRQQFHPGHPKAWLRFNSAATVAASYNITSVTDNGLGDWTVNIATDFSSANYCVLAIAGETADSGANATYLLVSGIPAAGTLQLKNRRDNNDNTATLQDPSAPDAIFAAFFGDQA